MSAPDVPHPPGATRSGFFALAGRPNVGKSTLANAIVGAKVAIVSDKPQTTRRAIRAVATGEDWQLVLVDLPGVQRPRDELTARMQRRVESELAEADGCLLVVSAQQGIGPGDRFIASLLRAAAVPVLIAANKIDRSGRAQVVGTLKDAEDLGVAQDIFPVSARTGQGVAELSCAIVGLLPAGPFYFAREQRSDQSREQLLAELIREQILARTREEVPHAVEVEIESITREPSRKTGGELMRVQAIVLSETDSQKTILIGAGGQMIRQIGTAARQGIERALGERVHLELTVKVRRHWRADERMLDRLGIE